MRYVLQFFKNMIPKLNHTEKKWSLIGNMTSKYVRSQVAKPLFKHIESNRTHAHKALAILFK